MNNITSETIKSTTKICIRLKQNCNPKEILNMKMKLLVDERSIFVIGDTALIELIYMEHIKIKRMYR
jgi:hypothetical protein